MAHYSTQSLILGIPSNIVAVDPIYNYKKVYNKYYEDNEDDKEDFYRSS